ncbi:helix-turn-helix transcriptional regulator [Agromyces sp. ISL-38]|uniref:helix-turn-helix transcriptional regulator n=1 Tax=Agromyces sp. ISL-38 TaxID=2819107 RepID=UPI001BEC2F4B|nr:helix-turn-helix transcriptional regulator [Agromyces sp. ISL-38]MBT2499159.1 helix-turn-helix transcriptional regulator [Agromyces sp. ISL-38]
MNARDQLVAGSRSLSSGEWVAARDAFQVAWAEEESADALDGLARALWWLNDPAGALELRARAFARLRHEGRDAEAAAVAIWLAREYRNLYRRREMADGWRSRARSLLSSLEDAGSLHGWLHLAESEADSLHPRAADQADRAVTIAREHGDIDLEIVALMRRGACMVGGGAVADGVADLHEAMAAATSGEGDDVQYVGEALCTLLEVAGLLGDPSMVEPWAAFLVGYHASYAFGPLLPFETSSATELISAFCTGCCGGVYLVTGRLDAAEEQLSHAVTQLITTGLRPRCLHPVADLVELRVLQGRLQDAEAVLTGFEDDPECAASAAALDLATGHPQRAVARLTRAIESLTGVPLLALPLHAALVDAALASGNVALAETSGQFVAEVAGTTATVLHRAQRDHAAGKLALAAGDAAATALLRSATLAFAEAGAALPACRARLALARSLAPHDRGLAVTEARSVLLALDRMGATAEADQAAAFLRELGVRGRTGPRHVGLLSNREREVLALVADGLSNAEIGQRLFISTKTAGHHVSSILAKLGVRSRTEAVAFAMLNPPTAVNEGTR